MTLSESVSSEVRAELGRKRITNKSIAEVICVSEAQANRLINGKKSFSFDQIEKVASHLGVDVFSLIQFPARDLIDRARTGEERA